MTRTRFLRVSALATAGAGVLVTAACTPAAPSPTAAPATAVPATAAPKPTAATAPTTAAAAPTTAAAASPSAAPVAPTAASTPAATSAPAATAASTAAASSSSIKTLNMATQSDMTTGDPQKSSFWPDYYMFDILYDRLTERTPDMQLVPGLATEWKLTNPTTWTFKLRPNVKFHDGTPFTANDVKFTIERTYDPAAKTTAVTMYQTVAKVDVVDDLTANFVTKTPDPILPAKVAAWGGWIIPQKYFNQVGQEAFAQKPIGTGPFKFTEWVKADHYSLEAVKDYWGGAPAVDKVVQKSKPEDAARLASLINGEVNWIDYITPDQVAQANTGNNKVVSATYAGFSVVIVNQNTKPLDSKPLRQAMSYAIDREGIVKDLLKGQGVVPNGSIPKGEYAYNASRPALAYDPAKAKSLLAQSSYKGEPIDFMISQVYRPVTEAIVAMWKQVGINATITVVAPAERSQQFTTHALKGVAIYQPGSSYGDPDGIIIRNLAKGAILDYWNGNIGDFQKLGDDGRTETDDTKRKADYEKIQDILLDEMPWIPVYSPSLIYGMNKAINFQPSPLGKLELRKQFFTVSG
jgi:peptide/nickel transport system substrate-binding protein